MNFLVIGKMKYIGTTMWLVIILTSCNNYVDRTFELLNVSSHKVRVKHYHNRNLRDEGTNSNQGSILSISASFDPEAETISLFIGDSVNFIFNDSLILAHYINFKPTFIVSPSFDKNITFFNIWTKVSNEYWTFEVTDEMYEEAVPLED